MLFPSPLRESDDVAALDALSAEVPALLPHGATAGHLVHGRLALRTGCRNNLQPSDPPGCGDHHFVAFFQCRLHWPVERLFLSA